MCGSPKKKTVAKRQCIISVNSKNVQVELNQGGNLTYNTGFDDSSFVVIISVTYLLRTRSDFEKHLTIKNCDKTFLKIILRLKKIAKKRRRFHVS